MRSLFLPQTLYRLKPCGWSNILWATAAALFVPAAEVSAAAPPYELKATHGPVAGSTHLVGMNSGGQTIGTFYAAGNQLRSFLWNPNGDGSFFDFASVLPAGGNSATVLSISDAGAVFGRYMAPDNMSHYFFWQAGALTDLGTLGGVNYTATNAQNQLVGYIIAPGSPRPKRGQPWNQQVSVWQNGTVTNIITAPGATPVSINGLGQVIGNYLSNNIPTAFSWRSGTFTVLQPTAAVATYARSINAAGQVAGYYTDASGQNHGFIWDGGSVTTIALPGGSSVDGVQLNAAGHVVFVTTSGSLTTVYQYANGLLTDAGLTTDSVSLTFYQQDSFDHILGYRFGTGSDATGAGYVLSAGGTMCDWQKLFPNAGHVALSGLYQFGSITNLLDETNSQGQFALNAGGQIAALGLANGWPTLFFLNPLVDTDADGLPDTWEIAHGLNPNDPGDAGAVDAANDGLTPLQKYLLGLDPAVLDSDNDGLPDMWEITHGLDPANPVDASSDVFARGITALQEHQIGHDPAGSYTLTDLGPSGGIYRFTVGINNAGQVIGSYNNTAGYFRGFLWQNGSAFDLGSLGGPETCANGINDTGQIVGFSQRADGSYAAFLWQNGTMAELMTPGAAYAYAYYINATGQVLGAYFDANFACHNFLWNNGTRTELSSGNGGVTQVFGLNDAGQVFGSYTDATGASELCVWQDGAVTLLNQGSYAQQFPAQIDGFSPSNDGIVILGSAYMRSINNLGAMVAGEIFSTNVASGLVWENAGVPPIYLANAFGGLTTTECINDLGQVVGSSTDSAGNKHAFVWRQGVMVDLNRTISAAAANGYTLTTANCINNQGQIVADAIAADGSTHALLLSTVGGSEGSGLPADWEAFYGISIGADPYSMPDGDGMTLLQKYQQHVVPGRKDNPAVKLQVNVIVR